MRRCVLVLASCVMHAPCVACAALVLGCTRPPSVVRSAPHPSDAPFSERAQLPYAPPSAPRGSSGDAVAIALTGGEEQGRSTALAMVEALLEGDAASLQALFAERIVYVMEGVERSSAEPIARCMQEARSLAYEPGLRLGSVVSPQAIAVRRADAYHAHVPMPPGISPNDWVVTLPPPDPGNDATRRVLCLHTLYVRPGPHSLIVGVAR